MVNSDYGKIVLEKFLTCSLASTQEVFNEFIKRHNIGMSDVCADEKPCEPCESEK